MRKKYFTSHNKLPILIILLVFSFYANAKESTDTNIICFATHSKWICAPENKQEIANKKATDLLNEQKYKFGASDIVINTIDIPQIIQIKDKTSAKESIKKSKPEVLDNNDLNELTDNSTINQQPELQIFTLNKNSFDKDYSKLWSHQLIGVSTPQSAINFIANNNLDKSQLLIVKTLRNNMDWWIVLFGLYQNKELGVLNAINLPKNIHKPWLRPLGKLQIKGFVENF